MCGLLVWLSATGKDGLVSSNISVKANGDVGKAPVKTGMV